MKLSRKSEYALLAMIDLAERFGKGNVRTSDICRRKKIPRKFLEQILLTLKRGGCVRSLRGYEGGFSLARPPEKVTLAEVLRLMDGALAPVDSASKFFYRKTPIEQHRRLLRVFREIRNMLAEKLEKTTLADVL